MNQLEVYDVIVSPVITEKATMLSENNQITFQVARDANKTQIKKAIETLFGVKVKAVNTMNRKGKNKRFRGQLSRKNNIKRAIVTLEEGHRIDVAAGL